MAEKNINQEQEQINDTQKQEEEYVINGFSRFKLAKLPKTFTEGYTGTKITFVDTYVK